MTTSYQLKRVDFIFKNENDWEEVLSKNINRPEWMIVKVVPVIPPDLRPLVPLDGGRFATSDLNDLYRRVIIRNNRLKRLIEIKAPEVILRNEKRMLQEAVDSLFDNSRKSNAVKTENNRALKSLSDSLKGKQGRFRQNLLGKRVDYSARSVIVVGPKLKLHECGTPKDMAAELFKPFVIRKLIERGIVKTVKSAKKIVDRKDPVVWDILENVLKGHPVMLNRAPTLHRLSIQAFQPVLVEGKAIQLHPLVCTGFNADFDGDQMAVHVPLGNAAVLEAQMLMLASHNILNPANGAPITVPSQDMVLGLYYITKPRTGALGEGLIFYSPEEVIIANNEGKLDLHAPIKVKSYDLNFEGVPELRMIDTTCGRVLFNEVVPREVGFINDVLTKKALRDIIGHVLKTCGTAKTAKFLDDIKELGFQQAFHGGLSMGIGDVQIPAEKASLVKKAQEDVQAVWDNYLMGLITDNERYNAVIKDIQDCYERGQPVLVGTTSIENSEIVSDLLNKAKLPHQVLNAKQHEREADIIAQAGRPKMITIATNMAGRGTDIVLGGNLKMSIADIEQKSDLSDDQKQVAIAQAQLQWKTDHELVKSLGGLRIVATERHESRRIDNQLRGRAGRQGDNGSSRFFLSLDDQLLRIFAGDRVKAIMERLKMPEGEAIEAGIVTRSIESAQRKVILDAQELKEQIANLREGCFTDVVRAYVPIDSVEEQWDITGLTQLLNDEWKLQLDIAAFIEKAEAITDEDVVEFVVEQAHASFEAKVASVGAEQFTHFERAVLLQTLDSHWRSHLSALDYLRQGIHLRSYAQKQPKQEY